MGVVWQCIQEQIRQPVTRQMRRRCDLRRKDQAGRIDAAEAPTWPSTDDAVIGELMEWAG